VKKSWIVTFCVFLPVASYLNLPVPGGISECRPGQRHVTVADAIEMKRLGIPNYMDDDPPKEIAQFSPDGERFAIVLKQGNIARNANDYSLLIYDSSGAFASHRPRTTITMSSTSNREAIKGVKWLKDSRRLLFIGENPDSTSQLYSLDVVTKQLRKLTDHPTALVNFDASEDGRVIVFEAEPSAKNLVDTPETRRSGFLITSQNLNEILLAGNSQAMSFTSRDLFLQLGDGKPKLLSFDDGVFPLLALSVSPNGRFALVEALVRRIPDSWTEYREKTVHEFISTKKDPAALSLVETYRVLDTRTAQLTSLVNAPKSWEHDGFVWMPDGKSIIVSRSFLPLSGVDLAEKEERATSPLVAEVDILSRKVTKLGSAGFVAVKVQPDSNILRLEGKGAADSPSVTYYRKDENEWKEVPPPSDQPLHRLPVVTYEDGMNSPPTIWIADPGTGQRTLLLGLNPQFAKLCFAKEEEISWNATDGHQMKGGLYLPSEYKPGERLPLVIQTHAFDPKRFWIDGPWSSAFAAQPLATKGIAVLQMGGSPDGADRPFRSTPEEATRQMAAIDGAIASLDKQGVIATDRIGIIGFSRTVFHVAYALTHSRYRFAAATLADGFDGGYFQSVAFPTMAVDFSAVNGGPPFGETLPQWLDRAPGFNLANVRTPIRLEAYSVGGATEQWEWFALLQQMKRPVDFLLLPQATHLLVKPWERMTSQQGDVDWFAFWLKGEEDTAKDKLPQNARWRALRALQFSNNSTSGNR
jgi:dipeptidyl aminopeptidase/acylaminoacyl peptidase